MRKFVTLDQMRERVAQDDATKKDIYVQLGETELVANGQLRLAVRGEEYRVSDRALSQIAAPQKSSVYATGLGVRLAGLAQDDVEHDLINRMYEHRWEKIVESNPNKQVLVRTRGETARSILTDDYQRVNHSALLAIVAEQVGGETMVRVNNNDYDVDHMNLQIVLGEMPAKEDREVGGLWIDTMNLWNSEIGDGRYGLSAALMRFVCTNGMSVVDQQTSISKVHKGVRRVSLNDEIKRQLDIEIPRLAEIRLKVDEANQKTLGNASVAQILGMIVKSSGFTQEAFGQLVGSYVVEPLGNTLGGVVGAVTRYSQADSLGTTESQALERLAGDLIVMDHKRWANLLQNAEQFKLPEAIETLMALAN
jgi:hypothetical protein